jgi:hypothetical protein
MTLCFGTINGFAMRFDVRFVGVCLICLRFCVRRFGFCGVRFGFCGVRFGFCGVRFGFCGVRFLGARLAGVRRGGILIIGLYFKNLKKSFNLYFFDTT